MVETLIIGNWYWVEVDGKWVPAVFVKDGFVTVTNNCSYHIGADAEVGDPIEVPKHLLYEPCPFCGGFDLRVLKQRASVRCSCGGEGPSGIDPISVWNKRA